MTRLHVHFSCGLPRDGKVISGMRRGVNVLIFLDVKKALEDGMKIYISDNKVILMEGFDGVVPTKYFDKVESWPDRKPIPLRDHFNVQYEIGFVGVVPTKYFDKVESWPDRKPIPSRDHFNVQYEIGFVGVVPTKYFDKVESWPDRKPIPFT